jgi:hypothetical protein
MRFCKSPPDATETEIRDAYRALARQPADAGGEGALRELNEAYSILSNPARRAAYDHERAARTAERAPAPTAPAVRESEPMFTPGPWPLRLWGKIAGWLWRIANIHHGLVPLKWMIGALLVALAAAMIFQYDLNVRYPAPVPATCACEYTLDASGHRQLGSAAHRAPLTTTLFNRLSVEN